MDQTTNLSHNDRRQAIERLSAFIVQSIDAARAVEKPFFHLEFDRVFPDDIYAQILALMPEATDYRPMHGRSKGHDLADGTHTRVKIDLFPEYIRNLPPEKRALWDVVGRALCSEPVKQAFIRRLAPGLSKRFGADFAKVGMYPIPILTRDIPGYLITPHTDTRWKGITVQLYLPKDDANTDIGTIFHEKLPDGSMPKKAQMRFAPNTGYAFAVGTDTWHSADPVHNRVKTRDSILLTYFVDQGAAAKSSATAASGSAISCSTNSANTAGLSGQCCIKATLTRFPSSWPAMVSHRRRRTFLTALGLYTFAALFIGYFAVNAFTGNHGLRAQADLDQQLATMQGELTHLKAERAQWERRVALLRSDRIDPDMLDERARALLGLADPRDLVLLTHPR